MTHFHQSSNVHSSSHQGSTMRIHFHSGSTYQSQDVTPAEYAQFLAASSKGKHWNVHLKFPNHTWTKVEG